MKRMLDRARCALAFLVLPWLLVACGPGGGGTGTGPVGSALMVTFSGTSIQSLLSAAAPGNCSPQCGVADLVLEDDLVQFATDCRLFSSTGAWGVDANGAARLHGTLVTTVAGSKTSLPATLELTFSEKQVDSPRATASLHDDQGNVVLGPFNLQRGAGIAPAFGSCPTR